MQEISKLTVFSGKIPNKAIHNDDELADYVADFLNYSGNYFVTDFNGIIGQFNTLSDEIQIIAQTISTNAGQAKTARDEVVSALAVLTAGAIDNTNKANNKTYSNIKVDDLFEALSLSNIKETEILKYFTKTLKEKLEGIEEDANNYSHPTSHDSSMITESAAKRFVSDEEKASWNQKQDELVSAENIKTINDESIIGSGNITVSGSPAGTVIAFASSTAPAGYLKANGAEISRTTYSALFAIIGTTFGAGDGSTTFRIPDLRGYFSRGWDDGRGVDTGRVFGSNQGDAYLNHSHTGSTDSQGAHTHTYATLSNNAGTSSTNPGGSGAVNATTSTSGAHTHTITVNASTTGSTETRPKNIALLYCIKY